MQIPTLLVNFCRATFAANGDLYFHIIAFSVGTVAYGYCCIVAPVGIMLVNCLTCPFVNI